MENLIYLLSVCRVESESEVYYTNGRWELRTKEIIQDYKAVPVRIGVTRTMHYVQVQDERREAPKGVNLKGMYQNLLYEKNVLHYSNREKAIAQYIPMVLGILSTLGYHTTRLKYRNRHLFTLKIPNNDIVLAIEDTQETGLQVKVRKVRNTITGVLARDGSNLHELAQAIGKLAPRLQEV